MKLIRCYIENFGGLQQYNVEFGDGLTIIHEPNGFGKTTLAEFIRAMFYGFPRAAKDIGKNPRLKYLPWQGGRYGGYLIFEHMGKRYRIDRSFGETPRQDKGRLFDEATHRESHDFSVEALGTQLFGMDSDSFLRSTYIPQSPINGSLSTDNIRAKLGNLIEDSGDLASFEKALQRLKDKRTTYEHFRGTGGSIHEAKKQITALQTQLSTCRAKQPELEQTTADIAQLRQEQQLGEQALRRIRTQLTLANTALSEAALSREYETLLARKQDADSRLQALRNRYPKGLPAKQEIDTAAAWMDNAALLENSLQETPADRRAAEISAALQGKFSVGVPTETDFRTHREGCSKLMAARSRLSELTRPEHWKPSQQMSEEECIKLDKLHRFFAAGVPDSTQTEHHHKQLETADRLRQENLYLATALPAEEADSPKQKKFHSSFFPLLILGILAAATGICLLTLPPLPARLAAIAAQYRIYFAPILANHMIIGSCSCCAAVITLIIGSFLQLKHSLRSELMGSSTPSSITAAQRSLMEENEQTAAALEAETEAFLQRYPLDHSRSLQRQLSDLETNLAMYLSLQERNEKRRADSAEATASIALRIKHLQAAITAAEQKISAFLLPYCGTVSPDLFRQTLDNLKRDADSYTNACTYLLHRKNELQQRDAKLAQLQAQLEDFFRPYGLQLHNRQALKTVERDAENAKELEKAAVAAAKALQTFLAAHGHKPASEQPEAHYDPEGLKAAEQELLQKQTARNSRLLQLEQRQRILQTEVDRIPELTDELTRCTLRKTEDAERCRLLDETVGFLQKARESLSHNYLGGVQGHFARYLQRLTGEPADHIAVNTDLEVQLERAGSARPLSYFSVGQTDLVQLCMRLALSDALFKEESCFMILDDPFVNLDDNHTKQALELLHELSQERQIIYLVCNTGRILPY